MRPRVPGTTATDSPDAMPKRICRTRLNIESRCLFTAFLIGVLPMVHADAQAPERMQLASQLTIVMNTHRTLESMFKLPDVLARDSTRRPEMIAKVREYYDQFITSDTLRNEIARIYAARFDVNELKGLIAFYQSPFGIKLLSEQANIAKDIQAVMSRLFQANSEELMRIMMKPPSQEP